MSDKQTLEPWEALKALHEGKKIYDIAWAMDMYWVKEGNSIASYTHTSSGVSSNIEKDSRVVHALLCTNTWRVYDERGKGWGQPGWYERNDGSHVRVFFTASKHSTYKWVGEGVSWTVDGELIKDSRGCKSANLKRWLRKPDW